jgi:hypothetical protein
MGADSTTPTDQMRHIAIRDFVLQEWTERNLIALSASSNVNASDIFTKQVGNILFTRHNEHISGWNTFFWINPDLLLGSRHPSGSWGWC